jgi:uncharacterized protein with FMN-binding domain
MYKEQPRTKIVTTVISIVVILGLVILIEYLQKQSSSDSAATTTSVSSNTPSASPTNTDSSSTSTTATGAYKNGVYTADSQYYVPHGYEDIKVTITIQDDKITDANVVNSESDRESAQFQESFTTAYKSHVVGKNIADLKLSYIAGASDTTDGFNDALDQIKTQAQS